MTEQQIILATQNWLTSFVIAYNICPFAEREHQRGAIRYRVAPDATLENALEALYLECEYLDSHPETATTLVIFPASFADFDDYLDLVAIAEQLLLDRGYEGTYQLASFHPEYRFADSETDDAANYTNRSPYPMLHIIREADLEQALAHYPDPESIPDRNIRITRELGLQKLQGLVAAAYSS